MVRQAAPELFGAFAQVRASLGTEAEAAAVGAVYDRLEATDFSRAVLARAPLGLGVLHVPEVGWSDLGEPSRVLAARRRIGEPTIVQGVA